MSTELPLYPFDPDGNAATNLVHEQQTIQSNGVFDYYYIIPKAAPFYARSVKLKLYPGGTELVEGQHYNFGFPFQAATHTIGQAVYGAITFYDHDLQGIVDMEYQTLGGDWTLDAASIAEILANEVRNPRITTWESITELPYQFPVVNHSFDIDDFVGMSEVTDELAGIKEAIQAMGETAFDQHVNDFNNPHRVTKDQVGLALVDNYATASIAEAQAGTANNRFMTPLRTAQAIEALANSALNAHLVDYNNPHQVTKAQVGLGSVQNYGLATQAEAEAGSSNTKYMTPLRTRDAIAAIVGNAFTAHAADMNNPHQTTKAQVGLGSVPNYAMATQAQAQAATLDTAFLSPLGARYAIMALVGDAYTAHASNFNNPHHVTAAQVGLGNVPNYTVATEADATDATANDKFMTPLRCRQLVNALVGDTAIGGHASNFNNPHHVTADQVGAFTTAQTEALLLQKLGVNDTSVNSAKIFGMDQTALETWIQAMTVANAVQFDGRSYTTAKADILTGKAADSFLLDGKSYNDIVSEISNSVDGSSIQYVVPAVPALDDLPPSWMRMGFVKRSTDERTVHDVTLMITGGRNDEALDDEIQSVALVTISATVETPTGGTEEHMAVKQHQIRYLNDTPSNIKVCYREVGVDANASLELWVYTDHPRDRIIITELSSYKFTLDTTQTEPTSVSQLITTRPADLVDLNEVPSPDVTTEEILTEMTDTLNEIIDQF